MRQKTSRRFSSSDPIPSHGNLHQFSGPSRVFRWGTVPPPSYETPDCGCPCGRVPSKSHIVRPLGVFPPTNPYPHRTGPHPRRGSLVSDTVHPSAPGRTHWVQGLTTKTRDCGRPDGEVERFRDSLSNVHERTDPTYSLHLPTS